MKRFSVLTAIVAALSLVLPTPMAFGQQSGVSTPIERRIEAVDPPAQADLLQLVLEFAPGAWTPVHVHASPGYVTVLEGEVTLRMGGTEHTHRVGEGWVDSPDIPHAAGNEGTVPARVVASWALPRGATPTTVVETGAQGVAPPGPTTVAQFRMEAPDLPTPMDVIHRMTEVGPGATVPMHTHPGPNLVSALQGNVSIMMEGMTHTYNAGDNWVEPANVVHGGTAGNAMVRIVTTTFAPRGAPVSTLAQQPAAPAQPKPGAPAQPKPGAPAQPKPGAPTQPKPGGPAAAPAQPAPAQPAAAPVQMPRALPRTGLGPDLAGAVAPMAAAGATMLLTGLALRRRRR